VGSVDSSHILVALPLLDSLATTKVLLKHMEVCHLSYHIISGAVSTIPVFILKLSVIHIGTVGALG
jgi:hypothetical protein